MGGVPAIIGKAPASLPLPIGEHGFDFSNLRRFDQIPPHDTFDVVPMRGLVVVFDRKALDIEGIQPGQLYVRESQRPCGAMAWRDWLETEARHGDFAGPASLLRTRRGVVQAIPHPRHGGPSFRLDSGFVDGPYKEWCYGHNLVGKVVGVYAPQWETRT